MYFRMYGRPRNKIVQALLRPKADNILLDLGWVITYDIRVAPRVHLSDGGVNLSKDVESLRGCMQHPRRIPHRQSTREIVGL